MIRRFKAFHKEKRVMIDVSEIDFRKKTYQRTNWR